MIVEGELWVFMAVIFVCMGILIVYSLEALLFLEQRFERTDALPISEREIQNIRWLPDVDNITILGVG